MDKKVVKLSFKKWWLYLSPSFRKWLRGVEKAVNEEMPSFEDAMKDFAIVIDKKIAILDKPDLGAKP